MKLLNAALKAAMNATLLAAAGASHAAAPTAALNHDPAAYRALTQKAATDYQAAVAKCNAKSGNEQDVCTAEAKLARVRGENEALARYYNTPKGREKMRTDLADAEYGLAKARCGAKSGADKDECLSNAKSVHTAAIADAKADRPSADATDASAATTATATATATAGEKVKAAATAVVEKTKEVAHEVAEKTKQAVANVTDKADKAADKPAERTDAGLAAADTAITAKVKAGLVKEPGLESLGIHVETEKGVVMLSGFVNSKAEAEKAEKVAKGVEGVTTVKSAIKVK